MCGIAGIYLRDPSFEIADLDGMVGLMLDSIDHRGGDATGHVALGNDGVLEWQKAACDSKDFNRHRRPVPKGTRTWMGHTRWATQGLPAFVENNHPLKRGAFFVIHNGHIGNDDQLFELAGRTPYGQVDSEAIPARFASFGKLAAAPKIMSELHGAAAIAAVSEETPNELVLARGSSSPLFVLQTKKVVIWASTQETVEEAYRKHIGRLPRKSAIKNIPEGTVLHFVNGTLKKSRFKVWSPPKVKVTVPITLPYKATSPELQLVAGGNIKDGDMLDCDSCGVRLPWNLVEYEYDPEERMTYQFCPECDSLWEYDGKDSLLKSRSSSFAAALDAEWAEVNEAILSEEDR